MKFGSGYLGCLPMTIRTHYGGRMWSYPTGPHPSGQKNVSFFDKDQEMGGAGGDSHQGVCNLAFQRRAVNFSGKHKIVAIKTLIFFWLFLKEQNSSNHWSTSGSRAKSAPLPVTSLSRCHVPLTFSTTHPSTKKTR